MPDYFLGSSDLNSVSHASCQTLYILSHLPVLYAGLSITMCLILYPYPPMIIILSLLCLNPGLWFLKKSVRKVLDVQEYMNHLRSLIVIITHTYFSSHPGFPLTRAQESIQNGHRNRTVAKWVHSCWKENSICFLASVRIFIIAVNKKGDNRQTQNNTDLEQSKYQTFFYAKQCLNASKAVLSAIQ